MVERDAFLAIPEHLHVGGFQVERRTRKGPPVVGRRIERPHRRGQGGSQPASTLATRSRLTGGRAAPRSWIAGISGTAGSGAPATSSRSRPRHRGVAGDQHDSDIDTTSCPPVIPRLRCLIGPIFSSSPPIRSTVRRSGQPAAGPPLTPASGLGHPRGSPLDASYRARHHYSRIQVRRGRGGRGVSCRPRRHTAEVH